MTERQARRAEQEVLPDHYESRKSGVADETRRLRKEALRSRMTLVAESEFANDAVILGAGFSMAVNSSMPSTDQLDAVDLRTQRSIHLGSEKTTTTPFDWSQFLRVNAHGYSGKQRCGFHWFTDW